MPYHSIKAVKEEPITNETSLSFGHRMVMKLLYQSLHRTPLEQQTAENRALIETYGKQVDFTDFRTLEPIIQERQRGNDMNSMVKKILKLLPVGLVTTIIRIIGQPA